MSFTCCFCGKTLEDTDAYTLMIRKTPDKNDMESPEQELYCHRACLERKLADPKQLSLKYM